ncbi:EpsG family protein [Pelagibacterium sp. 26DY04]|uniref:EpsG family protein n=1 Tax=Pelagibacterium sp. 26DY04 TaxID=2967130 RepID=UPI002816065D|nr:EpsG family protein [Pelagibacterium sp. 26DY04]WMT87470.1 EpsG family protein [Pelagibacterium sp. 26DY04]
MVALPYALVFAVAALCAIAAEYRPQRTQVLTLIAVLPAVLLAGFRLDVGNDFENYARIFQGQIIFTKVSEIGFVLFSWATNQVDGSGRLAFVASSLIICLGHLRFARAYSPAPLFAWCLFLALPITYLASLNLVKAHMAIAIALFAVCEAKDRRFWSAVPLLLVASSFHYLALALIPIVLFELSNERWRPLPYAIGVLGVLGGVLLAVFLPFCSRYAYFVTGHVSDNSGLKALLFAAASICVGIWYVRRNGWKNAPIYMLALYLALVAVWAATDTSNFFLRISAAFAPFSIVVFAILPEQKKLRRPYMIAALIALGGLMSFTAARDSALSYQWSLDIPRYANGTPASLSEMLSETARGPAAASQPAPASPAQSAPVAPPIHLPPQISNANWLQNFVGSLWICSA